MSLASYVPQTKILIVDETTISFRGLSAQDIGALLEHNIDEITLIFDSFKAQSEISEYELAHALVKLPKMACAIIAMTCADEGSLTDFSRAAALLPLDIQVDALILIGGLTFSNGLGKFIENINHLLGQIKPKAPNQKAQ